MVSATRATRRPVPGRPTRARLGSDLAGLAVRLVLAAERAVLAQFEPVGVVPPVLAGDVIAVLALLAGQSDLWPDVGRSHGGVPFSRLRIGAANGGPGGAW